MSYRRVDLCWLAVGTISDAFAFPNVD